MTIEENEHLYGPGRRIVLWTQGCTIHCPGCTNQHIWKKSGGTAYKADEIFEYCIQQENIDGITLHGGEPTDQMAALLPLLRKLKSLHYSVILFTGYEIESFTNDQQKEFISYCDLIKYGPFVISQMNRYLQFRGSSNQRIIRISERFKDYPISDGENVVLLDIDKNGIIINKGFPDEDMDNLINEFSSRNEIKNDS
jgi:anaerobic ribonucleoside-triphosphate reductase activating protein